MNDPRYFDELNCAVTVCNLEGKVIYYNKKAAQTFAAYGEISGMNLKDCHSPASWEKIMHMLQSGNSNAYTIEKKGQKKFIYQTPWYDGGEIKGLVEFSFATPAEMPHHLRD